MFSSSIVSNDMGKARASFLSSISKVACFTNFEMVLDFATLCLIRGYGFYLDMTVVYDF
jgi:hypothetical protein